MSYYLVSFTLYLTNHKNTNQASNQKMTNKISNIVDFITLKNQNSPWGQWNGDNPKPNKDSQSKKLNPTSQDEIEQAITKIKEFFTNLLNGTNNKKDNKTNSGPHNKNPKSVIGLFFIGLILLWLSSGIYKVDSNQNGLILYFGKFYSISTPGLNYHLPMPFGKVIKKNVTNVNTDEFGFSTQSSKSFGKRSISDYVKNSESLMLTGDENIVDIDFQVQWQISDIKNFVFSLEDPELAIRKASESAMREIIAKTPIADALSDGKGRIEQETKLLLQEMLDSYEAGVRIVLVQMRRVDPPSQVIDAFRDVQTAKADKEREINQAQSYSNDIIPRARGEASKITENAKAYKEEVVANAQGQASRFNSVYNQYVKAKVVTKKRMYLERMEKLYRDIDKIIIDKNISKTGLVPYLPISSKNSNQTNIAK